MAYSKRSVTRATKQSKRLLNAPLPCGYDAAMIDDDPARANHEKAIKHRVGRFTLADLVAKHHELKEYYEANTKDVG